MNGIRVGILGTGSALPQRVLTNADLEKMVDTSDEWIVSRTGIRERRIADENTAASDLSVEAANKALEDSGISPDDIDLIICATVTPDFMFPATACLVQDRLGIKKTGAFDLSAGCSGFLYGLSCAVSMIQAGVAKNALVIGVDTLSKITDYTDRNTCVLFGDGAGAVVLGQVPEGRGFLGFDLGADGSGGEQLMQLAGGSRNPATQESVLNRQHSVTMNGKEVFKFAVRVMNTATEDVLRKVGLTKEDVDFLVPHQANIRIIDYARERLGLPQDKVVVNVDRYGNMSSASIPVALDEAKRQGRFKEGDVLLMVGFGAGLTWGAAALRW
ncbi:beta-ketoacyl-ACP synthase III [Effusibacillus lacus]|uniref:Beta-ketoacyl-[acyl-carrier-protein] synthase III n=1 Tax=Effusibacillus lacus TaxID=1348429 RepID=A0A292YNR2_9BACL|nr:beta-ketoacyl-ACP synthase III [Effusibacillus lacus]TCS76581.1 3-oxoacyl-[acyl-carrier-protein] synthase-3 [Effusibacillus lacus]GAX90403.1 3-oxoacyl-ACP synthase [Effusibacillus lacus]